ncbi:MAG: hypothetical protein V4677_14530 [Bacteroidota bacterium]
MFKKIIRKLTNTESESLENSLSKNGLPFKNQQEAEKYFFNLRDKELIRVNEFKAKYPELNLDNSLESLIRLEEFYFNCVIAKTIVINCSKIELEDIITHYTRLTFVHNDYGTWDVEENDFSEGNYELVIRRSEYNTVPLKFGRNLDQYSLDHNKRYLHHMYSLLANV